MVSSELQKSKTDEIKWTNVLAIIYLKWIPRMKAKKRNEWNATDQRRSEYLRSTYCSNNEWHLSQYDVLSFNFSFCSLLPDSSLTLAIKDIQIANNEYAARGYASKEGPTASPSLCARTNWLYGLLEYWWRCTWDWNLLSSFNNQPLCEVFFKGWQYWFDTLLFNIPDTYHIFTYLSKLYSFVFSSPIFLLFQLINIYSYVRSSRHTQIFMNKTKE